MAAVVVSSLAAFVAGIAVPALPTAGIGGDRVGTRSNENADGDTQLDWSSHEIPELRSGTGATGERCSNQHHGRDVGRSVAITTEVPQALVANEFALPPVLPKVLTHQRCPQGDEDDVVTPGKAHRRTGKRVAKFVQFNLDLNTAHEITPYAEVYGAHPKSFDFAKGPTALHDERLLDPFEIVQVPRSTYRNEGDFIDSDSDDEEDEAMGNVMKIIAVRRLPWSFWMVSGALLVWLQVMCPELSKDLVGLS